MNEAMSNHYKKILQQKIHTKIVFRNLWPRL